MKPRFSKEKLVGSILTAIIWFTPVVACTYTIEDRGKILSWEFWDDEEEDDE